MDTYITIERYENLFEAEFAASYLHENNVDTKLINERVISMLPALAGPKICVELQVLSSQKELAVKLLEEVKQFSKEDEIWDDDEDDDWDDEDWDDDDDEFSIDSDDVKDILADEEVILDGHFQLTSGRHSPTYVEKIMLLQNPNISTMLCGMLARKIKDYNVDTVIGPAYGAIALAFEVASRLDTDFIFCQRVDGKMSIRSGFDLSYVKKVAIVEDVVTTGGSVKEVIECLKALGIKVVVVAAIVDRSDGNISFGVPFKNLVKLDIPSWEPDECPLCKKGIPLQIPGSSDKKR